MQHCVIGKMANHFPMQSRLKEYVICMVCHMTTLIFCPTIRLKRIERNSKGRNMEYKLTKTIECPNFIIRVHSPVISSEERNRRMKAIKSAAEKLMKGIPTR